MKIKTLLIITAFTTPVMVIIMMLQGAPLKSSPATPMGILNLEFAATVNKASDIINSWKPGLIKVAVNNTLIDFLFLLSYGCFLYACCISFSKLYHHQLWKKIGWWASRFAFIAALFDVVENLLMFRILAGSIYKEMVASTFMFAAAKFLLVTICLLYILFSLAGLMFRQKATIEIREHINHF